VIDPGYGFVALPPDVRRVARDAATWGRRVRGTLAGRIDIELTTEQPIHVGSGNKQAQHHTVVLRHARVRGGPGIPGSSFKGVLRARYEAITRSCAPFVPKAGSQKIRSSTGVKRAYLHDSALDAAVLDASCTEQRACPACALFGRMSLRSRITVTDLACAGDASFEIARMPERFGPNLHHVGNAQLDPSGNAFEVRSLHGRKFGVGRGPATENRQHVEVIPVGTVLTGQLRVFNATPAELGGVLAALGCDPASALKLGGGKAHGFGRVRCKVRCHLTGDDAPLDPAAWRQSFIASPDRWLRGEQDLISLHRRDC
jgi:CRISPR/Cas system CSM-associated protein Csm3 (group 7 of RAMP superfamily)